MNTQQPSRPVITQAMRDQAAKQPNTWLYVVDPIFTDPNVEVPPWGFIGGYRVDERGNLTDDFSPNPNYRPSPVALRMPAPTNDVERALQLSVTGYTHGQTLLLALLDAQLILFAQPQGSGLFALEHESGRRQVQAFTSDAYLPPNWSSWQRLTGRQLASQLAGMDLQINPTSSVKARIPGEDLIRVSMAMPGQANGAQPDAVAAAPAAASAPSTPAPMPEATPAETTQSIPGSTVNGAATGAGQAGTASPAPSEQAEAAPGSAEQPGSEPASTDFGKRFLGSLLAGAIGDALGAPVEFYPVNQIRSRYGDAGVTGYETGAEQAGQVTDDTQMTLFTLEGLIRGHLTQRTATSDNAGTARALSAIQHAYQRWLHTQGFSWPQAGGPYADKHTEPDGWLIGEKQLFASRSPGSSCIAALRGFAQGSKPGTFQNAINESKGCAGAVRVAPVALWSDDPREVFELAAATAALTQGDPSGYLPAGVLAVIVHRLLRGESVSNALSTARALLVTYEDHEEQERLLQAAVDLTAKGKPTPEQVKDALGGGWVAAETVAIGVCAVLSTDNLAEALLVAVNHSGDSDSTAAVCGTIAGAWYGLDALPADWLRDLKPRAIIEDLATDALREFGDEPPAPQQWSQRYPTEHDALDLPFASTLPTNDQSPETSDVDDQDAGRTDEPELATDEHSARVLGFLLGGAIGDALGYAVEFDGLGTIRQKYGQQGITDFVDAYQPGGSISDDTQMTLFTLEGLIRANIRRRLHGESEPDAPVQHAYQRWLHTQGFDWKEAGGPIADAPPDGWLIKQQGLFVRRAPGATCIQALHGYASGNPAGSIANRLNNSKGCGGVMRAAPVALWSDDPSEVFRVGAHTAALTHGHPSGFLPAGALAVIVQQLLRGRSVPEAIDRALTELSTWDDHEETTSALRRAIEVAAEGQPTPEQLNQRLGEGWVGEEALAIAVCAALVFPESYSDAVLLATNHNGDSDSTAAICGNIVGAAVTSTEIPGTWREKVEFREIIEQLARDAVEEFGPNPPSGAEWLQRYPARVEPEAGNVASQEEPEPAAEEAPSVEDRSSEDAAVAEPLGEAFSPEAAPASAHQGTPVPAARPTSDGSSDPAESGDGELSYEELKLLVAWRKFRAAEGEVPAELTAGLRKLVEGAFGPEEAEALVAAESLHDQQPATDPRITDRLAGSVLGGAIGDALGAGVTFHRWRDIESEHGPEGITGFSELFGRRGTITSNTQMTLFTLQGVIEASRRKQERGAAHPPSSIRDAYLQWLHTQGAPDVVLRGKPQGPLADVSELHAQRFPEQASLIALAEHAHDDRLPTREMPVNDSASCGAVVRSAPLAFWTDDPARAFELGVETAVLTHGHPDGYLPAGALTAMLSAVIDGRALPEAVQIALGELREYDEGELTANALHNAVRLAVRGRPTPEQLETLGSGWQAPQALAIAVAATLAIPESFAEAVQVAANHSGNSAATATICGSLAGALHGGAALPAEWRAEIELHDTMEALVADWEATSDTLAEAG